MWLDKLREMKNSSKLTTKEISTQSGIPEPTLEKLFAGVTKDPKLETIRQLVHFLGYTLDDLEDSPKKGTQDIDEVVAGKLSSQLEVLASALEKLNDEGQEKLLDYADDLVSSGKYIKSDSYELGEPQEA